MLFEFPTTNYYVHLGDLSSTFEEWLISLSSHMDFQKYQKEGFMNMFPGQYFWRPVPTEKHWKMVEFGSRNTIPGYVRFRSILSGKRKTSVYRSGHRMPASMFRPIRFDLDYYRLAYIPLVMPSLFTRGRTIRILFCVEQENFMFLITYYHCHDFSHCR
jgi:hypothetical protein